MPQEIDYKKEYIRNNCITVYYNCTLCRVNNISGRIMDYHHAIPNQDKEFLSKIVQFNLDEHKEFYNRRIGRYPDDYLDINDLGYWIDNGSEEPEYVPASEDYRNQILAENFEHLDDQEF